MTTADATTVTPHAGGEPTQPAGSSRAVLGFRLFAGCLALVGFCLRQAGGLLVPDTKLDLVVDPWRFLGRALHLWEPLGFFGQVQNQAYGYLLPMGPFFAFLQSLGLPPWVVQRLWWALLLCLAFVGVTLVARALAIGGTWAPLFAGMAYALSPRILTTLGPVSVEAWPMALAPWVLLPLVRGAQRGSPRRAAALSGLAVLATGGVNAAATVAALVPAALWLLTRQPGPRRRRLSGWWVLCVVLASLWWVVSLLVLGRSSPPFLDYIESSTVTTSVTSLFETLRGTSHWIPWLTDRAGPQWAGGWLIITAPLQVLDTVLLAALGLAGLAAPLRTLREGVWLRACLLVGLVLVTFGHVATVAAPWALWARGLLDGPLAPLRNLHKFDPSLRLALALGCAHLLATVRVRRLPSLRVGVVGVAVLALVGGAVPLLTDQLAPRGTYTSLPSYWSDATTWLARAAPSGRALLLPASSFPEYTWGRPNDEPVQALSTTPWAVRDAIPLAPANAIRFLDAVQQRIASGRGSPGLADALARAGVSYVVVRNDLDSGVAASTRPLLVHQALTDSGGFSVEATFGPAVGGANRPGNFSDQGLDVPYPAVEVFSVAGAAGPVSLTSLDGTAIVRGGPESMLTLDDAGMLDGRPALLAPDFSGQGGLPVVTDDVGRREVFFGRIEDNRSAALAPGDPLRLGRRTLDYLEGDDTPVPARLLGAVWVTASSSASDPNAAGGAQPEHQPWSAVDGDLSTSWLADRSQPPQGQWWDLRLPSAVPVGAGTLTLVSEHGGPAVTRVRLAAGGRTVQVPVTDGRVSLAGLGDSPVSGLRVTFVSVTSGLLPGSVGIGELSVPGLRVGRALVVDARAHGGAQPWVVLSAPGGRDACFGYGGRTLCASGVSRVSEESTGLDRLVTFDGARTDTASLVVHPRPGSALDTLLDSGRPGLAATASSTAVDDPRGRATAAVDDNIGTGWVAAAGDPAPELRLTWSATGTGTVTGLRIAVDPTLAASAPRQVLVSDGRTTEYAAVIDGVASLRTPLRAGSLRVLFTEVNIARTTDPYTGRVDLLPVGVSEIVPLGVPDPRRAEDRSALVGVGCDAGPVVQAGSGGSVHFSVTATRGELLAGDQVAATACVSAVLDHGAGQVRVDVPSTALFQPLRLTIAPAPWPAVTVTAGAQPSSSVVEWGSDHRIVRVSTGSSPALLRVTENANAGWVATLDGRTLQATKADGWQQAWVVPAGASGDVVLDYVPDRTYRGGLLGGLFAVLLLAGLALVRPRVRGRRLAGTGPVTLEGRASRRAVLVVQAVALLALGGWPGLAVYAAVLVVVWLLPVRGRWWGAAAVAALVLAAAVPVLRAPWPTFDYAGFGAPVQLLVAAALSCALVTARVRPGVMWRNRKSGRSTSQ